MHCSNIKLTLKLAGNQQSGNRVGKFLKFDAGMTLILAALFSACTADP